MLCFCPTTALWSSGPPCCGISRLEKRKRWKSIVSNAGKVEEKEASSSMLPGGEGEEKKMTTVMFAGNLQSRLYRL